MSFNIPHCMILHSTKTTRRKKIENALFIIRCGNNFPVGLIKCDLNTNNILYIYIEFVIKGGGQRGGLFFYIGSRRRERKREGRGERDRERVRGKEKEVCSKLS